MSARDRARRDRQRAKWGGGPFAALPRNFAQSKVLSGLSPIACKLLLDLIAAYTGFNNGDMAITWSQMRLRGWKSKATLQNATNELLARGIVIRARVGGRRACHLYAVTIWDVDECNGKLDIGPTTRPPNLWLRYEPVRPLHELQDEHKRRQAEALRTSP